MNQTIHEKGVRLLKLRSKLRAREGTPGYEKNCEELRKQIAVLEKSTSTTSEKSSAVASETNKD